MKLLLSLAAVVAAAAVVASDYTVAIQADYPMYSSDCTRLSESKSRAFRTNLESRGWQCTQSGAKVVHCLSKYQSTCINFRADMRRDCKKFGGRIGKEQCLSQTMGP
ncbi:hypothetical protein GQ42DRAFT_163052 [Ramicandelaber brevisporus]|nr:hypothetical protein GQ42DRAFT_163052 [Ramicandelaber brevisporus]